jgi:CheY-like chemotaxis protein
VPGQWAIEPALTGPDTVSPLTAPGGRLHEARRAVIDACAQSEFLELVAPQGALYAFPSVRREAVAQFDDAQFALELLERDVYDVLLADIGMPRMDGLQLIEEIRRSRFPTASRMPALALTAFARAEDKKTALAKGFQRHVAKPVQPTELVFAVAELVQQ